MKNETYDRLKVFATLWMPIATFISTLLPIWHVPYADQLIKTMSAITVLMNGIVTGLKKAYDEQHPQL